MFKRTYFIKNAAGKTIAKGPAAKWYMASITAVFDKKSKIWVYVKSDHTVWSH